MPVKADELSRDIVLHYALGTNEEQSHKRQQKQNSDDDVHGVQTGHSEVQAVKQLRMVEVRVV